MPILQRDFRPQSEGLQGSTGNSLELKQLAFYQKGIILSIACQCVAYLIASFLPQELKGIPGLVAIAAIISGTVFAGLAVASIRATAGGIIMCVCLLFLASDCCRLR